METIYIRLLIKRECEAENFKSISSTEGKKMFKKEVERLVLLGFLENPNESKWVSPSFAQPKPYKNQVSFISEFRNSNDQLEYKPYTMPNINEM